VWPNGADFDPATLHDWPDYVQAFVSRARSWMAAAHHSAWDPAPRHRRGLLLQHRPLPRGRGPLRRRPRARRRRHPGRHPLGRRRAAPPLVLVPFIVETAPGRRRVA